MQSLKTELRIIVKNNKFLAEYNTYAKWPRSKEENIEIRAKNLCTICI